VYVSSQQSVTGYLTIPEVINSVNTSNTIGVTYNINAGTDFVGLLIGLFISL
jgi:hypothetical protein